MKKFVKLAAIGAAAAVAATLGAVAACVGPRREVAAGVSSDAHAELV